jgi:hypothetical protein
MADQFSRNLSRLVPIVLSTLMAYSPAQTNEQPEGCVASADTGQPIWFQRGHLLWGLSTRPAGAGEKIPVVLWFHNPSDTQQFVMTCSDIDYFWARTIEVFDSAGKHVLSRTEEEKLAEEKQNSGSGSRFDMPWVCFANAGIPIPPHTCLHGSFAGPPSHFTGQPSSFLTEDLSSYYALPPGRYSVVPISAGESEPPLGRTIERRWTLPITVLDR